MTNIGIPQASTPVFKMNFFFPSFRDTDHLAARASVIENDIWSLSVSLGRSVIGFFFSAEGCRAMEV